jgi:hypothetical protein
MPPRPIIFWIIPRPSAFASSSIGAWPFARLGIAGTIEVMDQPHRSSGGPKRILENAADDLAVGEHVVVLVLPLAGRAGGGGAFEEEAGHCRPCCAAPRPRRSRAATRRRSRLSRPIRRSHAEGRPGCAARRLSPGRLRNVLADRRAIASARSQAPSFDRAAGSRRRQPQPRAGQGCGGLSKWVRRLGSPRKERR